MRHPEVDFLTAHDARLAGVADPAVLAMAAHDGRVLVSHDKRTMPTHAYDMVRASQHIAGLIMLPQEGPLAEAIKVLILVWQGSEAEEWVDKVVYFS